jgi:methylmalonyl-CoA/ethylmalonyl-CoA epimerase
MSAFPLQLPNSFVTQTRQVCIVSEDLDATIREYSDRVGIGPWWIHEYAAPELTGCTLRGRPVEHSFAIALAWTGDFNWEVIQPLKGPSIYREFLETRGMGMHHVGIMLQDLNHDWASIRRLLDARGCEIVQEGRWQDIAWLYFETPGPTGACFEIIDRPRTFVRPPPRRWYPSRAQSE